MGQRSDLQTLLEMVLGSDRVYFQPPPNVQMEYPCIVYQRDFQQTEFADNTAYSHMKRYQVTAISRDPDSPVPDYLRELRFCSYDRFYTAEGLNHDVFKLFF